MSARIRPARAADIEPVCALLHDKMNPKIAPERWRRLMTYDWLADKPDLGRVVEADGRILGYVGMVYADRTVAGRRERIVNICAWYLDKSLRGEGLGTALMADATADDAMSYDIMTSSSRTLAILEAVGYRVLDDARWVWRRGAAEGDAARCTRDMDAIRAAVDDEARRMLDDHAGLPVTPLLAEADETRALIVFSVKHKAEDVTWFDVLHTSDQTFLGRHGGAIAAAILPEDEPAVLAADCRFVAGDASGAAREMLPVPRFYKSRRLQPHQIDHLYTELQLLDLKLD
jgi:GNAT superfamily N-acetyltransferase